MPLRFPLLALFVAGVASAQETPPLATDRPDFTESAVVVPLQTIQLEAGLTLSDEGETSLSGPEALVRIGVARSLEVRLGLPSYVAVDDASGVDDPSIGVKVAFGEAAGWALAAIAEASLPLGDARFGSSSVNPLFLLIAGRDIGAFSVGTQAELGRDSDADRTDIGATLVVGRGLGARAGAFLEGAIGSTPEGPAAVVVHHGYTVLLAPTVQVDARVGAGVTRTAPDLFGGFGLSVRF